MKKNFIIVISCCLVIAMILLVGLIRDPVERSTVGVDTDSQDIAALFYKDKTIKFIVPYDPGVAMMRLRV